MYFKMLKNFRETNAAMASYNTKIVEREFSLIWKIFREIQNTEKRQFQ